jgi:hypothetical protein
MGNHRQIHRSPGINKNSSWGTKQPGVGEFEELQISDAGDWIVWIDHNKGHAQNL